MKREHIIKLLAAGCLIELTYRNGFVMYNVTIPIKVNDWILRYHYEMYDTDPDLLSFVETKGGLLRETCQQAKETSKKALEDILGNEVEIII